MINKMFDFLLEYLSPGRQEKIKGWFMMGNVSLGADRGTSGNLNYADKCLIHADMVRNGDIIPEDVPEQYRRPKYI